MKEPFNNLSGSSWVLPDLEIILFCLQLSSNEMEIYIIKHFVLLDCCER